MNKIALVYMRFLLACILLQYPIMRQSSKVNKAVLIIENDPDLAQSIRLYLEDTYKVYVAKDSSQLADFITRHKIGLILTDLDVSSPDLHHQLSKIKVSNPDIKIILMYMFLDEDEVQEQLIFNKADDYIFKPFDADVLRNKLEKLLALKPPRMVHN